MNFNNNFSSKYYKETCLKIPGQKYYNVIYTSLLVLIATLWFEGIKCEREVLSSEECADVGFNKEFLRCTSCKAINATTLVEMKSNCLKCCEYQGPVEKKDIKIYPTAYLEVCTCKFGAYPQIQAFILKPDREELFPNLHIRYIRGLDPILKLANEYGEVKEVLAIEKWNTDTVIEFLDTYLLKMNKPGFTETNKV